MKYILPILFLLLGVCFAEAQVEIKVEKRIRLEAPAGDLTNTAYTWYVPPGLAWEQRNNVLLVDGPAGTYRINVSMLTIDWDNKVFKQETGFVDLEIEGKKPTPGPDDPPNPKPDEPTDAPFDAPGLTVVVVYEYQDAADLTPEQREILGSGEFIAWLRDATNQRSGFWDDDSEWTDSARKYMKDGFEVAKKDGNGKAWVAISNGKTGTSVALPASIEDFKTLVQRYQ